MSGGGGEGFYWLWYATFFGFLLNYGEKSQTIFFFKCNSSWIILAIAADPSESFGR